MEKNCYERVRIAQYSEESLPLVSVAMIAYNLENYLAEAIESVLNQYTNFKIELVIGEDCSTDKTMEIAKDYQFRYPDIIKILVREKNLGLTPNSIDTQNNCKGKYIALLDGDDFWTDDYKLQKQIDVLESDDDYSACAHQSIIIKGTIDFPVRNFGIEEDAEFVLKDTIRHRKFHTSALVYRKEIWDRVGGIPSNISSNERAIYPMLSIFGKIKYLKDNMCVYRLAPTGLNSRISTQELATDLNMLPWLKSIDPSFPVFNFRSFLHLCMFSYPQKVPLRLLLRHYFSFVFFSFSYFPGNLGDIKYGTSEFFRQIR